MVPIDEDELRQERILADEGGVWVRQLDPGRFCQLAAERFPHRATDLREHDGLLHLQVHSLGDEVLRCIEKNDAASALSVMHFLDEVLAGHRQAPELENALQISFVTRRELTASDAGRAVLQSTPERVLRLLA